MQRDRRQMIKQLNAGLEEVSENLTALVDKAMAERDLTDPVSLDKANRKIQLATKMLNLLAGKLEVTLEEIQEFRRYVAESN